MPRRLLAALMAGAFVGALALDHRLDSYAAGLLYAAPYWLAAIVSCFVVGLLLLRLAPGSRVERLMQATGDALWLPWSQRRGIESH
jgi:hypothetical protein